MTVLRVTVLEQYFCTKHPDLNVTAREKKQGGDRCPCLWKNIYLSTVQDDETDALADLFSDYEVEEAQDNSEQGLVTDAEAGIFSGAQQSKEQSLSKFSMQ